MKRTVTLLLLFIFIASNLFSSYTPYQREEFPDWSLKLRRAETLTFGALPITFALSSISYATARSLGAAPFYEDPLKDSFALLSVALSAALIIAVTDFIIGEVQRR